MKTIILDGNNYDDIYTLHIYLKKVLCLPEYYGGNLNALWDCLTGWIDLPVRIIWSNFELSKVKLGQDAIEMRELFNEAMEELNGFEFMIK